MLGRLISRGADRRNRLENPNLPLNDPDAWDEVFGGGRATDSGIRFGADSALRYSPVWQAVGLISGDVAKLPLNVYRRLDGSGREIDRAHPAFRLLRRRPNDEQGAFRFWRLLMVHALIWGNGYAFVDRDGAGRPLGLYPMLPDRTRAERIGGRQWYVTETQRRDGSPWLRPLSADDVLHVQGLSTDGVEGCRVVELARNSWALGLVAEKFASRFFASGGRMGGTLEIPAAAAETYQTNLESGFRRLYESENGWFKTVVLRDGAKFNASAFGPDASQMSETRGDQRAEVASWFNLPPSKLGVKGSVSYNSQSESNQAYLDSCLSTWLVEITQECEAKLLSPAEQAAGTHYLEHNAGALLRMDPLKAAQVGAIAIRGGWRNPDEQRALENLPPRGDGRGGEFVEVNQAKSPGGADKGAEDKPRGPAKDAAAGGEADDEARHRRRRVVFNVGARARHKSASVRAWQEWLDGGLQSHRAEAKELLGDDAVVGEVLARLRPTLEGMGHQEVPAAVDRIMTELERAA